MILNKELLFINNKVRMRPSFKDRDLYRFSEIHGDFNYIDIDDTTILVHFNNNNLALFTAVYRLASFPTLDDNYKIITSTCYKLDRFESTFIRWITPVEIMIGSFEYNNNIYKINNF